MGRLFNHHLPVYASPTTRGECISGTPVTGSLEDRRTGRKQCHASCRHNLLMVESSSRPGRPHAGLAPEGTISGENTSAGAPSCSLDVADTGPKSSREVARVMGMSPRRVEQIVKAFKASHKAMALHRLGEDGEEE